MAAKKKSALQEYLQRLIRARPNDAVRLAFMEAEEAGSVIGTLDLALLSEIKRGANGAVEVKLVDRAELIEKLAELESAERAESAAGANFFEALDRAAGALDTVGGGAADEV
jgi:hypothetical protein